MRKLWVILTIAMVHPSCEKSAIYESSPIVQSSPKLTESEAIAYLLQRGHNISEVGDKTLVALSPEVKPFTITVRDIEAINALNNVTELRTLLGITPEVFEKLRPLPELKAFAVHYAMPDKSLKYLKRFPNVEKITFWGDGYGSFETFPVLQKLRVLRHEAVDGEFSIGAVRRIAACKNLEEIIIQRPIPSDGINLLKALPNLKYLDVADTVIVDTGEQVAAPNP